MALWSLLCYVMLYVIHSSKSEIVPVPSTTEIPLTRTIKSPANLSYQELVYILKSRHGMADKPPRVLTPCARAILGCCDDQKVMNEACSETLKCGAFFFDDNPCEDKFIIDALQAAKKFYEQFNKV